VKHHTYTKLIGALALLYACSLWGTNRPRVTIRYRDQAKLDFRMLTVAKRVASRIFERANITLAWEEECTSQVMCDTNDGTGIHLIFLTATDRAQPCSMGGSSCARRLYDRSGGTVYILCDRAEAIAERLRQGGVAGDSESAMALVLGHFVAHEIGHLLLPNSRHAVTGIMMARLNRREWQFASAGSLLFNPGQASAMRASSCSRPALH
jgi:hypothetical protein